MTLVTIPVYTPTTGRTWTPYRTTRALAPRVWLLFLYRGLRARMRWPVVGRAVVLADMLAFHPGRAGKCLCRGAGVIATYRGGARGVQFCARMVGGFRERAGYRCV